MRTLKKVPIIPIYLDIFPLKENMEFGKLYISLEYKSTSHLCLCGCGIECHLPINSNGWSFEDKKGKITMNLPYFKGLNVNLIILLKMVMVILFRNKRKNEY